MILLTQHRRRSRVRSGCSFALCCVFVASAGCVAQNPQSRAPASPSSPKEVAVTPPAVPEKQKQQAEDAYIRGAKALDHQSYPDAEKQFAQALKLNPSSHRYVTALALAHEYHISSLVQQAGRQRLLGHTAQAEKLIAQAHALDPHNELVVQHEDRPIEDGHPISWNASAPVFEGAIELKPSPDLQSFHLQADAQQVIRSVAQAYGIRTVFDDSVPHKSIRFQLENVPYTRAMRILLEMNELFMVPLDSTSILIARDNPENRQKYERLTEQTFYVPGLTKEQMSDVGNVLRNIFDVKQSSINTESGSVVVRAPEATLKAVGMTLSDLLDGSNEVLIELKLYSISKTHNRTTGLSLPQQIGIYNVASQAQSLVSANQSVVNQAIAQGLIPSTASVLQIAEYLIGSGIASSSLLTNTVGFFGGGLTATGIYATGGASLDFGLTSSDTQSLDDIRLRVSDHQQAQFRVGSRYPIITSTYSTGVAANSSSLAGVTINGVSASSLLSQYTGTTGTTIPQIQYEDLGLTLDATPNVTKNGDIYLKLDLKVEALAGGSLDNIPILNSQQYTSEITVGNGQTALLLSNLNRSEMRAVSGLPGLGELPGFQDASDLNAEADSSQLVLLLTPHIIRRRPNLLAGPLIPLNVPRASSN